MNPHPYVTNKDDWGFLCDYWVSDKFKTISERNTSNQSLQEIGHSNGSVSFAQTKQKAIGKGEQVDRVTMFFRTHTKKKDQSPTDEASRMAMEKLKALQAQVAEGSASYTVDQIFIEAVGEDRHGRIRGNGAGPLPTFYGRQRGREIQLQEQLQEDNDKIKEANTKLVEQAKDIATMKQQLDILMAERGGQRSEQEDTNENAGL